MGKAFITTKLVESTKENGLRTENMVMESWNTQTKTVMKATGRRDKGPARARMNTLMVILIQDNGETTLKTATESLKWRRVTFMKEIGLMEKKMVSVSFK
jgi:hypothetical protein